MGLLGLLLKDWEEGFEKFGKSINEAVFPFVDTYFENDEFKVAIDLAGFEDSDIDEFEIRGSVIIVSGKRKSIKDKKTITPIVLHRPLRFRSIIPLPFTTKENEKTPKFTKHPIENGVLTITIHKTKA